MAIPSNKILTTNIFIKAWKGFRRSNPGIKIVQLNCACFLLLRVIDVVCVLSGHRSLTTDILQWGVEVPSSISILITRPWTLLTYMFAQYEVWHAIFNILCFLWFAPAVMNIIGNRRIWSLYISGGLCGALLFIVSSNLLGAGGADTQWLIGSSAAVLGVTTATAILCSEVTTQIFVLGEVKLRWVAMVIIVLCFVGGLTDDARAATSIHGTYAHIGGVAMGAIYALCFRKGGLSRLSLLRYTSIFRGITRSAPLRNCDRDKGRKTASPTDMRHLDDILDKIKSSGFASLTAEERKRLFEVSHRITERK